MKRVAIVIFISFYSVAVSILIGASESAGLFGAIIGVGGYLAYEIDCKKA